MLAYEYKSPLFLSSQQQNPSYDPSLPLSCLLITPHRTQMALDCWAAIPIHCRKSAKLRFLYLKAKYIKIGASFVFVF